MLHVVPTVDPMKLPPLRQCERTDNRMDKHCGPASKALLTATDRLVHGGEVGLDLLQDVFRIRSARHYSLGSFSSGGEEANPDYDCLPHPLIPGRRSERLTAAVFEYPSHGLGCARIRQGEVLEDFSSAPLSLRVPAEFFKLHSRSGTLNGCSYRF